LAWKRRSRVGRGGVPPSLLHLIITRGGENYEEAFLTRSPTINKTREKKTWKGGDPPPLNYIEPMERWRLRLERKRPPPLTINHSP
jgi:hypothetical protein